MSKDGIKRSPDGDKGLSRDKSEKRQKNKLAVPIVAAAIALAVLAAILIVLTDLPASDPAENDVAEQLPDEEETTPEPEPTEPPEPPELTYSTYAVVEVDVLRLRDGPGTDYAILDNLTSGAYLKVLGYENEWLKVEAPGGTHGWVHGDYTYEDKRYDPLYSAGDYYDPTRPILISYWQPGDEYWSEYGYEAYWHISEIKLDFSMRLSDIKELMGEPDLLEEETVLDDTEHMITMKYPFMTITCYYSTSQRYGTARDDAYIVEIDVHSDQVKGPREITVGDSFDHLLTKVPSKQNPLVEIDYTSDHDEQIAYYKKVLYGSPDEMAPYARVYFDENKEPLSVIFNDMPFGGYGNGGLYITIEDGKIKSFHLGWQHM